MTTNSQVVFSKQVRRVQAHHFTTHVPWFLKTAPQDGSSLHSSPLGEMGSSNRNQLEVRERTRLSNCSKTAELHAYTDLVPPEFPHL